MVDVKKGDLIVLLPQDEKDGVEHVEEAWHPRPPAQVELTQCLRVEVVSVGVIEV